MKRLAVLSLAVATMGLTACDDGNKKAEDDKPAKADAKETKEAKGDTKEAKAPEEKAKPVLKEQSVTMSGVKWTFGLVEGMKAPQWKHENPEFLGPDDMTFKMTTKFPKFSSIEKYIKMNIPTEVTEQKKHGDATLIVFKPQKEGSFSMRGIVIGQELGWYCWGDAKREAEIRAMCESVKYERVEGEAAGEKKDEK